ncbi:MAG: transcriptional regulator, LysR family-like protein [Rhodoferax sp.]|nr:transcriptional regulator, LysR family-like protein [Rhodoferax sp.]
MHDLDLTTLRLFVAVCDTGNITRAGEHASIVGSAISKRLAQLEQQLGTPLLERKRHGVLPTEAGQTLLEHARTMLDNATRITRDMTAYAAGARGQVRVLASVSALTETLAADVARFLKAPPHRSIRVDLEERVSPEIVRGVREGLASLGVCWDAVSLGALQSRPYCVDHLCVVVPKGHALASRKSLRFAQTLGYEHVAPPANSAMSVLLQRAASQVERPLLQHVTVTNFEVALAVVATGLGISVVPREMAEAQAAARGLRLVPLVEPWAQRRFVVCFQNEASLPLAARMLLEHLAPKNPTETA